LRCQQWRHAEIFTLRLMPGASEEARRADGMHGAIVKARKTETPAAKGLPVIQPAAKAGCC
jgi:hypothetical protein